jgi:hypothetical protein
MNSVLPSWLAVLEEGVEEERLHRCHADHR